jgi:predicted 3-demethylubiquinone-9 3-methyltransferase (glyoxalase superfamily)
MSTQTIRPKISPFLWFNTQAEEAARFYVSVFPNSSITAITRYGESGPGPKGSVMTVAFLLDGQEFIGLNGGPNFKFTEAISFMVNCETQEEVDRYWAKLTDGGQEIECGWLKDKYGLCWQIVPVTFMKMVRDPDPDRVERVMKAMMTMKKFDIAKLEAVYRRG